MKKKKVQKLKSTPATFDATVRWFPSRSVWIGNGTAAVSISFQNPNMGSFGLYGVTMAEIAKRMKKLAPTTEVTVVATITPSPVLTFTGMEDWKK